MADIFNNLMTKKLGYKNYLAQGGDWGGAITLLGLVMIIQKHVTQFI